MFFSFRAVIGDCGIVHFYAKFFYIEQVRKSGSFKDVISITRHIDDRYRIILFFCTFNSTRSPALDMYSSFFASNRISPLPELTIASNMSFSVCAALFASILPSGKTESLLFSTAAHRCFSFRYAAGASQAEKSAFMKLSP